MANRTMQGSRQQREIEMSHSRLWIGVVALAAVLSAGGQARSQNGQHRRTAAPARSASEVVEQGAVRRETRVPTAYLFRGLFDVNSLGMDDLAGKLRARGVEAGVYSHTQWEAVAENIIAQHRAGPRGPIVLIGHSLGGSAAILLAEQLGRAGIAVDLIVPVDPVGAPPVPANVRRAIDYYQANNGYGGPVGPGAGFQGVLVNADLESNRRDLWDQNLTHITIDKSPRVHAEIIRAVLALGRPQR
jgi:fermentation-respiration switch protein FrsA (DUF1100 family)